MNTSIKLLSLAALTAATLALPAAAEDMNNSVKCQPSAGAAKCGAKCGSAKHMKGAKCGADKPMKHMKGMKGMKEMKCGARCAPKCGVKGETKN